MRITGERTLVDVFQCGAAGHWKFLGSRLVAHLLTILACIPICSLPLHTAPVSPRVVLVVANYLSLDDLVSAGPNTRRLLETSAIGLVNTGAGRGLGIDSYYVAIGAGTRLLDLQSAEQCYNTEELIDGRSAGDLYRVRLGRSAPDSSVVCLGLPRLTRGMQSTNSIGGYVGLLGDVFHSHGLRTAVVGNSDTLEENFRRAPTIAMDQYGVVDSGIVDSTCSKADATSPCGLSDDIESISEFVRRYIRDHSLVVAELGDLNRCEAERTQLSVPAYIQYRRQALRNLDLFIGNILPDVQRSKVALILCSPCRYRDEPSKQSPRLAPLLIFIPHGKAGLLTSNTTRTPGLISNVDIGPTILKLVRLQMPSLLGSSPAEVIQTDKALTKLQRMERIANRNYRQRNPFLLTVGILVILSATLGLLILHKRNKYSRCAERVLLGIYLLLVSMPAALLLVDGLDVSPVVHVVLAPSVGAAIVLLCWGVGSWLAGSAERRAYSVAAICIFTSLLIVLDGITGFRLLRYSMITCDQIIGIRYYGLGNEYMGILIVMALLGAALLSRTSNQLPLGRTGLAILGIWFALVAIVIGYPSLGANAGGLVTAVLTFGGALIVLSGMKFRFVHVLALLGIACVVLMVLALLDAQTNGNSGSHLGRSVSLAKSYGSNYLWILLERKITMHIGILKMAHVRYLALAGLPFLVMYSRFLKSGQPGIYPISQVFPTALTNVLLVGCFIAFLVNDSGIVPAALMFSICALANLYFHLTESAQ